MNVTRNGEPGGQIKKNASNRYQQYQERFINHMRKTVSPGKEYYWPILQYNL
jgi:hypothetical protein